MMISRRLLLCLLVLAGCQSHPTEDDARKWFSELRPAIDAVEKRVLAAMEDYPYAGPTLSCEEVIAADPLKGLLEKGGPEHVEPAIRCLNANVRWHERAAEREGAWDESKLLVGNRFTGVEAWITRTKPLVATPGTSLLTGMVSTEGRWRAGCGSIVGATKPGHVPPDKGIHVDGFRLGWGLANISYSSSAGGDSYEDSNDYPVLYVLRAVELPHVNVEIRMSLLATTDVPVEYRESTKRSCR